MTDPRMLSAQSSTERRKIRRYTLLTNAYQLRHWWNTRGPWPWGSK